MSSLNSGDREWPGGLTRNGQMMVLFSDRSPVTASAGDLYLATRAGNGQPWVVSWIASSQINTQNGEQSAHLNHEGTVMHFASTRGPPAGQSDIWVVTRPSTSGDWSIPVKVGGINTDNDEDDPWLSPDQRTIYFSRTLNGNRQVFVATR